MKKIHLSIAKPCREDWNNMTPDDKGKFCAACQKSVIDFTNMSDRQIAEFFKKPPQSVCGRVYNDQLNREIVIPKKRIPRLKYFFQFTLPVFVLFLKSCGVKDNTQGKIKVQAKVSNHISEPIATLGVMIQEIKPVKDTIHEIHEERFTKGEMMGDVEVAIEEDTIKKQSDSLDEIQMEKKPMDTVVVVAYPATMGKMTVGAVSSVCTSKSQTQKDSIKKETLSEEATFKVYPNPVKKGASLTIAFETESDYQLQFFSSSGQLILSQQNKTEKTSSGTIQIPSNIATGIYFLQIIAKNKQSKTTRVIVTE